MKRKTLMCLLLVLVLVMTALLAGCSKKDNRVAAKVGDREITMQQLRNAYFNSQSYAMYYFDLSTDEGLKVYQDYLLDSLIENAMLLYQAEQADVRLTEEEEAKAVADGEDSYADFYQGFVTSAKNAGATDVQAYANKLLTDALSANGMTLSELRRSYIDGAIDSAITLKYQAAIRSEVEPTAEELKAMYDEELADQKARFTENPAEYFKTELAASYGTGCMPLYVPEGFFRVRHILVAEEATAQEILDKLANGEDFEQLLTEYNTDPGMKNEAYADGYLVGEGANFVQEFLDAALALKKDGDVSPITKSSNGYHIIKRVSTEPSAEIAYADEQEKLDAYFTNQAKSEHYSDRMTAWLETDGLVVRFEDVYREIGK